MELFTEDLFYFTFLVVYYFSGVAVPLRKSPLNISCL
jgi:hypothetical protein